MSDQKKYICIKCNFFSNYKKDYNEHIKTEKHLTGKRKERSDKKVEESLYTCTKCDYSTNHTYNLKSHILNNHSTIEERKNGFTYYCDGCNYGIFSKTIFEKHLLSKKHIYKNSS